MTRLRHVLRTLLGTHPRVPRLAPYRARFTYYQSKGGRS